MRAVGVDLGGTKTAVAVVAPDGTMGEVLTAPTPALAGGEAVLDAVADLAARAAAGHDDVAGVGVGTAGVVDATRGAIISATETFASWVGTDVAAGLRARLGWDDARLVEVRNDVDGHLEAVAAGPAIERAYALAAGEPLPGRDITAWSPSWTRTAWSSAGEWPRRATSGGRRCAPRVAGRWSPCSGTSSSCRRPSCPRQRSWVRRAPCSTRPACG